MCLDVLEERRGGNYNLEPGSISTRYRKNDDGRGGQSSGRDQNQGMLSPCHIATARKKESQKKPILKVMIVYS